MTARPASVHVRDAYPARRRGLRARAGDLLHRMPELAETSSIADADARLSAARLRAARSRLALVRAADGALTGVVSLDDLLTALLAPAWRRTRPAALPQGPIGSVDPWRGQIAKRGGRPVETCDHRQK
ncbi:hypothetical protein [Streptosporangium minutum]|uniref:CBS domain-containing protein n=1 Tax=Streptosporangium minutum TaxID=569862 RepID=A0A243RLH6_9ACTN|nr:hypothetical protein [Streptosporangium minutum]OUC95094.1 hypothetical protein CA984_20055 [Streptosporangium minutum]